MTSREPSDKITALPRPDTRDPADIDIKNVADFEAQVLALGRHFYPTVLAVQRDLQINRLLPFLDVMLAPYPAQQVAVARELLTELVSTGRTRCRSPRQYRVLRRMRDQGQVRRGRRKGYWVASQEFANTCAAVCRFVEATGERWSR